MKKLSIFALALPFALGGLLPSVAQASDIRAGVTSFQPAASCTGTACGVYITFGVPMPNANYAVTVQETNTAGFSPTKDCTYFNVLHLTPKGFDIQHKRCDDGTPIPVDTSITIEWIAVSHQ